MTETIIHLDGVNPIEFFGINNSKLDALKNTYTNLKILARGTQIKLSGPDADVQSAKAKIDLLVQYLQKNGDISEMYFTQILENEASADVFTQVIGNNVLVHGHNGKVIKPKTANQQKLVNAAENNDILFVLGPAGTGKTYTAVALAVRALKNKLVKKIVLTRPAVEAGENLGFLPGDLKDKIDPYLRPLYDALDDMIPPDKLSYFLANRIIEIAPLAYMRGRTLDNCFIILDEAQNATDLQLKMFLTRIGAQGKAIITGDLSQIDLPRNHQSGLLKASSILKNIKGIETIVLTTDDVLRHKLVRAIIKAYEQATEHAQEQKNKN